MNDLFTICKTTYTRILRTRALYLLLAILLLIVAAAHLYHDLTMGREKELMFDTGAVVLAVVGLLTGLVVVFDVARDMREKLVVTLLSKPLGRTQYLLGKFAGVIWAGTINLAILTAGISALLYLENGSGRPEFLKAAFGAWGAMVMATGIGVLLITFLTEIPAVILTLLAFGLGHATERLYQSQWTIGSILFGVLPNFALLQFKSELSNGLAVDWSLIGLSVAYACVYTVALLSVGAILFHRRDLA